jgi:hypothetical protein
MVAQGCAGFPQLPVGGAAPGGDVGWASRSPASRNNTIPATTQTSAKLLNWVIGKRPGNFRTLTLPAPYSFQPTNKRAWRDRITLSIRNGDRARFPAPPATFSISQKNREESATFRIATVEPVRSPTNTKNFSRPFPKLSWGCFWPCTPYPTLAFLPVLPRLTANAAPICCGRPLPCTPLTRSAYATSRAPPAAVSVNCGLPTLRQAVGGPSLAQSSLCANS